MANQPDLIPSAWAANNSTTETIPATTTESGKASWDQGFPVETSLPLTAGGIPPRYGDFNGVLNALSQFALFAQSGGHFTWSATQDYSVGSIVLGTDGSLYRAAQVSGPSTSVVNPVGDTSGAWERVVSQSDIAALQEDIQDAMDTAADAASNAAAAQSAVTTLDANVVKLTGAQTITGAKTFSGGVTLNNSNINYTISSGGTGGIVVSGENADFLVGRDYPEYGAELYLEGRHDLVEGGMFALKTGDYNFKSLVGSGNGTLTWNGSAAVFSGEVAADTMTVSSGATISGSMTVNGSNVNTASKPGVKFVEVNDGTSHSIGGQAGVLLSFTAPTISGYTPSMVVGGRGIGNTGLLVAAWPETNRAWVYNCRTGTLSLNSVTFTLLYVRS